MRHGFFPSLSLKGNVNGYTYCKHPVRISVLRKLGLEVPATGIFSDKHHLCFNFYGSSYHENPLGGVEFWVAVEKKFNTLNSIRNDYRVLSGIFYLAWKMVHPSHFIRLWTDYVSGKSQQYPTEFWDELSLLSMAWFIIMLQVLSMTNLMAMILAGPSFVLDDDPNSPGGKKVIYLPGTLERLHSRLSGLEGEKTHARNQWGQSGLIHKKDDDTSARTGRDLLYHNRINGIIGGIHRF